MRIASPRSAFRAFKLTAMAVIALLATNSTVQAEPPPVDHSAHVHTAAATGPSQSSLNDQVIELQAKVANLEAALQQKHPVMATDVTKSAMSATPDLASSATGSMPGMTGTPSGAMGMKGMDKMNGMPMGGMAAGGAMPGKMEGPKNMMQEMGAMMQEMGGMMQSMPAMEGMGMGGMGAGKAGTMSKMNGGGQAGMKSMQPGPMKMEPDMMRMESMMGMPPGPAMADSAALPGFPGASHLYHIGADDFFLNHDQHITLSTAQRAALGQIKEKSLMEKATVDRKIAEAEQELWQLTASDQPNVTKLESKIRDVEQLRGSERLNFIRSVGEAAKVLTPEQRQQLLGMSPPAMPQSPATPGMGGGMNDM